MRNPPLQPTRQPHPLYLTKPSGDENDKEAFERSEFTEFVLLLLPELTLARPNELNNHQKRLRVYKGCTILDLA
jgi:hypothetical protein